MRDLETLENIVAYVLEQKPYTRASDTLLYAEVCNEMNPTACRLAFTTVLTQRKEFGLPKYDSVGRVRRKLQAEHDDLRPSDDITDGRYENWKAVRKYARK